MKRKGKPKGKTKQVPAVNEPPSLPVEITGSEQLQVTTNNPLISISVAPASSSRSGRTSCASGSLWSVRSEMGDDLSLGSSASQLDCKQQQQQQQQKGDCQQQTETPSGGIESVKRKYVELIAYNKSQCFLLGALLFAVIQLIILFCYLIKLNSSPTTTTTHEHQDDCDQLISWTVVAVELPLAMALAVIFTLRLLDFASSAAQQPEVGGDQPARRKLTSSNQQLLAVALAVAILLAPTLIALFYLHLFIDSTTLTCSPEVKTRLNSQAQTTAIIIVYILPLVLGQISHKQNHSLTRPAASLLLNFVAALPVLIISTSVYYLADYEGLEDEPEMRLLASGGLILLAVAAICGQLRGRQLMNLTGKSIFKGASELIEAKVSLEQQRQQQETLLLSVLPAYVAEQVKRTMVKRMESMDGESCVGGGGATGSVGGQEARECQMIVSQCQQVGTQTMATRSLTLPENSTTTGNGDDPAYLRASAIRRSFAHLSRLSSSVASSAAYLGGALLKQANPSGANKPTQINSSIQVTSGSGFAKPLHADLHTCASNTSNQSARNQQASSLAPASTWIISGQSSQVMQQPQVRRGFNELYIRTYNNVSLLYGDIVGFTSLCTQLSSSQLVRVLNNLFSYFDHLADQHRIMRIKILGDCYYGVSGIPEFAVLGAKSASARTNTSGGAKSSSTSGPETDNHAINCVNMGLDMISYIKCLNIERESPCATSGTPTTNQSRAQSGDGGEATPGLPSQFELNMRIGIHTGHIHSGVIGLKKWQFDVWSNDVSIAMHCESSGVAGRVQVTEATICHLREAFSYEPAPSTQHAGALDSGGARGAHSHRRDSFLIEKNIRTFLICDRLNGSHSNATTATVTPSKTQLKSQCASELTMDEDRIRAATVGTIRQTLLLATELPTFSSAWTAWTAFGLAYEHADMRLLDLQFKDSQQEVHFQAARQVSSSGALGQLLIVFALLLLLLLIDRRLLPSQSDRYTQVGVSLLFAISSVLLIVVGARLIICSSSSLGVGVGGATTKRRKSASLGVQVNHHHLKNSQHQSSLVDSDTKLVIDGADLEPEAEVKKRVWEKLVAKHGALRHWKTTRRVVNSGPCLWLLAALFMTLAAGQLYLMVRYGACQHQLYSASLIGLVLALDLTHLLLNYTLKSSLLMILSLLQAGRTICAIGSLFMPNNLHLQLSNCTTSRDHRVNYLETLIDISSELALALLCGWSLAHLRQMEYSRRCNFLWRNKLNVDHEELEYISGINKVLLENILPSHVVQHYLETGSSSASALDRAQCATSAARVTQSSSQLGARKQSGELVERRRESQVRASIGNVRKYLSQQRQLHECHELYHEQHSAVAVMFASIPHFYEFYDESDISKQGLGCIALLNEIICDFDKLLLKNKFSRIEKIKTIGSTYMAAAGLRPTSSTGGGGGSTSGQRSPMRNSVASGSAGGGLAFGEEVALFVGSDEQMARAIASQQKQNLVCMIQFATSLMSALNGINKQSFQVFKLRVGVNTGPVIAGIIGAQRPFYDIWGDCVNIASRMESLGEIGRIQVEERTAKLLLECLCSETYCIERRGHIDVKGKGGMVTYFVDKKATTTTTTVGSSAGTLINQPPLASQTARDESSNSNTAAAAAAGAQGADRLMIISCRGEDDDGVGET